MALPAIGGKRSLDSKETANAVAPKKPLSFPNVVVQRVIVVKGDLFAAFERSASASIAHDISACCSMSKGIAAEFKARFGNVAELQRQSAANLPLAVLAYDPPKTGSLGFTIPSPNQGLYTDRLLSDAVKPDQKEPAAYLSHGHRRFVYNLIIKENYYDLPTYESLARSLLALRDHCEKNKVERLFMSRFAAVLYKMDWTIVFNMIRAAFDSTNTVVFVYTI